MRAGVILDPGKQETSPKEPRRQAKVSALRSGLKWGVEPALAYA